MQFTAAGHALRFESHGFYVDSGDNLLHVGYDIKTCRECVGAIRDIAFIEDQGVIDKILTHLAETNPAAGTIRLTENQAPSPACLCD